MQCHCKTLKGVRCKLKAKEKSEYCFRHQKCKSAASQSPKKKKHHTKKSPAKKHHKKKNPIKKHTKKKSPVKKHKNPIKKKDITIFPVVGERAQNMEVISCLPKILTVKKYLGSGVYGSVYKVCIAKDCNWVIKVQIVDKGFEHEFLQEVSIGIKMSQIGVGPKIYDTFFCRGEDEDHKVYLLGFIVLEGLDGTLYDLVATQKDLPTTKAEIYKAAQRISFLIEKMHAAGYYHHDLHQDNLMYKRLKKDGPWNERFRWYIIDYGLASSESNGNDDFNKIGKILQWINNQIK
jgi:tRNA A-37 threonylcarbamoyl transferase component Bud32